MKSLPKYRQLEDKEREELKDKVCESAFKVYQMLRHNNIRSVGVTRLSKDLQALYDFYDDGKDTE